MLFKLKILYYLLTIKFLKISRINRTEFHKKILKRNFLRKIQKSTYYKRLLDEHGRIEKIPLTNKKIFMENFDLINTAGISIDKASDTAEKAEKSRDFSSMIGATSVGLSTGTSGKRGIFLINENERARWVAYVLDRVIGFSFQRRKLAFFLRANNKLYQSVKSKILDFQFFDIHLNIDEHISKLNALKPHILIAQPSVLVVISKLQIENKISIQPNQIISVAEVLSPEDRIQIEKTFQLKISEVYQCTEGFLAASCERGTLHFNEDYLIIEKKYINAEKTKFHPVITDLLRKTQPIVRYELNDIISEKKNCICGNPHMGIEQIEGRSDDIIIMKTAAGESITIFPDIIRRTIVLSDSNIDDYKVTYMSSIFHLAIESVDKTSFSKAKNALIKKLNTYDIYDFEILKKPYKSIDLGRKRRRVENLNG